LAPSEDHPRSDVNTVARFNDQVFAYTASLALPVVDRRVQVLLQDDLDARVLETVLPPEPQPEVARLAHGLDKVLFKYVIYQMIYIVFLTFRSPSVQWARDPRTGTLNIDPEFENLPVIQDFDSDRLQSYVTSSRDEVGYSFSKCPTNFDTRLSSPWRNAKDGVSSARHPHSALFSLTSIC
jgi:hypothetical protein